jgi:hypothetical protein
MMKLPEAARGLRDRRHVLEVFGQSRAEEGDPVDNSYDRLPGLGDPASMHCGPQTRMRAIVAERRMLPL